LIGGSLRIGDITNFLAGSLFNVGSDFTMIYILWRKDLSHVWGKRSPNTKIAIYVHENVDIIFVWTESLALFDLPLCFLSTSINKQAFYPVPTG